MDDLCDYLVKKYSIDVPVLDEVAIYIDRHDTHIDSVNIFGDPFVVSGTTIDVIIPFTGARDAFGRRLTYLGSICDVSCQAKEGCRRAPRDRIPPLRVRADPASAVALPHPRTK